MKIQNKFLKFFTLATLVVGFASCSDDNAGENTEVGAPYLKIENREAIVIQADGTVPDTLRIQSNVPWKVSSDVEWCKFYVQGGSEQQSVLSGKGDAVVLVDALKNGTMTSREGVVTVSAGVELEKEFPLKQFGREVEVMMFANGVEVQDKKMEFDMVGSTYKFDVYSNVPFEVEFNEETYDWCTAYEVPSQAYDQVRVYALTIADNAGDERQTWVKFKQKGGDYKDSITFVQRPHDKFLRVFSNVVTLGSHFRVADLQVSVTKDLKWEWEFVDADGHPTSAPSWMSDMKKRKLTPMQNRVWDKEAITGRVEQNLSTEERECWVKFIYEGGHQIVKVVQQANNPVASDSIVLMKIAEKNSSDLGINVGWDLRKPVIFWEKLGWTEQEVDGHYRINRLILGKANLCYDLTPDVANLTELTHLTLAVNFLSGSLPEELALCDKLYELNIADNFNDNLAYAPHNELSGITEIPAAIFENCTNLEHLMVTTNSLTELPASISNLTKLTKLEMGRNPFKTLPHAELTKLKALKRLDIGDLKAYQGGFFDFIFDMPTLEMVLVNRMDFKGQAIPDRFDLLPNLADLAFDDCNLSGQLPRSLGECPNMKSISFADNNLDGELPAEYGSLDKLRFLAVTNNNITGSIPQSYCNMLDIWYRTGQDFGLISVDGNRMNGTIPTEMMEHDVWTGKYANRTDKDGNEVYCAIGNMNPETFIIPQQEGYGFTNIETK